jgi:uncharacterized protein
VVFVVDGQNEQNELVDLCFDKLRELESWFKQFAKVLVMLSGGIDSTTLLAVAIKALGPEDVVAVTINSPLEPPWDLEDAIKIAKELGVRHLIIDGSHILRSEEFVANDRLRCYYCKKSILSKVLELTGELGVDVIVESSNYDDLADYRPGLNAVREFAPIVRSPYIELGIGKKVIRAIAKFLGISIYDKPPSACLATRIPHGTRITLERVEKVRDGELFLRGLGFRVVRVRDHGDTARIEVGVDELNKLLEPSVRNSIVDKLKSLGYKYVTVDLEGYRGTTRVAST